MTKDRTLCCRRELKYLVTASQAEAITRFIEPFLPRDHFSRQSADGYYPISSLYLDSHDLRLFQQSMDGMKNRFKLRVRAYSDAEQAPLFLEIKRRMNSVIIKNRVKMTRNHLPGIINGKQPAGCAVSADQTTRQFMLYSRSMAAQPKVLVRYSRRAYENESGNRVRVTFDQNLYGRITQAPEVAIQGPDWYRVPLPGVILEIKFTGHYPPWVTRMVSCFGLSHQSISKYTLCLRQSSLLGFRAPGRGLPQRLHHHPATPFSRLKESC